MVVILDVKQQRKHVLELAEMVPPHNKRLKIGSQELGLGRGSPSPLFFPHP